MKQMVAATVAGLAIARMRALTALADEGSRAATARRLGPSHTAVAGQIRDLEQVFGQTIFDRANGRLKDWRRVATRHDRCPKVFLSAAAFAASVMFWL